MSISDIWVAKVAWRCLLLWKWAGCVSCAYGVPHGHVEAELSCSSETTCGVVSVDKLNAGGITVDHANGVLNAGGAIMDHAKGVSKTGGAIVDHAIGVLNVGGAFVDHAIGALNAGDACMDVANGVANAGGVCMDLCVDVCNDGDAWLSNRVIRSNCNVVDSQSW